MLTHILFPSDLSDATNHAFQQMLELARAFKAKVTLFHAYELLSTSVASMYDLSYSATIQELELSMEEKAGLHLGDFKKQLDEAGIECEMVIQRGPAGQLIVELAKERQCDLIVMGNRGLGPVSSFLMGSTSTYVLHHTHCPMLVIPVKPAD